jgi:hypothetical protein
MKIFSFIQHQMALLRPNSKGPAMSRKIQFAGLFLLLGLLSTAAQSAFAQNQQLTFGNNFFVTGDYVVAGANMDEEEYGSYATGTFRFPDLNPGIRPGPTNNCTINGIKYKNCVPAGAQIIAALLYWQTVEKSTTIPGQSGSGQDGFFRPVYQGGPQNYYSISGVNVTGPNPVPYRNGGCSGSSNGNVVRTYRADVRAYLPQDVNGDIQVNGVVNGITYGTYKVRLRSNNDGSTPNPLGSSLVIIYRVLSPGVPLNGIAIYEGNSALTPR